VIADPPGNFFTADSFAAVEVPVQLWASESGGRDLRFINVTPEGVAAVDRDLPAKHEYRVVPKAWHFDFLLCSPDGVAEFCTDALGFDRAAFHKEFNAEVLRFFHTYLTNH
jgi:predicted dienelactone hydrolase